jgi:hypothetical protein
METKIIGLAFFSILFAIPAVLPQTAFAEELKRATTASIRDEALIPYETGESKYKAKFSGDTDIEKRLMEVIPYAEEAKYMWNVVDGDVDLFYVKNLRGDRKNKGLSYTTNTIPFMGDVDGLELKFSAGEEMKFSFESDIVPFMGRLEGFKLKGSVGDDSKIFFRYTVALD